MRGLLASNLQRFKLVTFDVTDTLLSFRHRPEFEYAEAVRRLGFPEVSEQRLATEFRAHFQQMNREYPNFGRDGQKQLTWENWWRRLIAQVLQSSGSKLGARDTKLVADHLIDRFETSECWNKAPMANELIDAIRASGQSVGIISNFDPRLKFLVENVGLPKFDFILASYEVGATKPNPQIFDLALRMCPHGRISAGEALHVGNTPTLDYVGALEAGWSAALISNGKRDWEANETVAPEHVFESLADFKQKLEDETICWEVPQKADTE